MYVLDVIPIAKAVGRETLTYFTSELVASGMLISVPLRSKKVPAIVTAVEDVRDAKSRIRALGHELRRIDGLKAAHFLLPSFVDAATKIARHAATTTGSVIWSLLPKPILEHAHEISGGERQEAGTGSKQTSAPAAQTALTPEAPESEVVQVSEQERMAVYRRLIRESFAHGHSVVVLAPTVYLASRLAQTLSKGIEQHTLLMHGDLKPERCLISLWKRALIEPHPLLIVGTGSALGIARPDIALYILEEEMSRSYKQAARPFLDIRMAAEEVSRAARARFVLGSTVLRVETLYRSESGEAHALVPPSFRPLTAADIMLIDMTKEKSSPPREHTVGVSRYALFSSAAETLIRRSVAARERVLIFAARRGLAPITICGDCEQIVICRACRSAVVLHSAPRRNIFRCHRCGAERDAHETCTKCDGWRLVPLGVGTETVANTLRTIAPETPLSRIDSDVTPTGAKAEKAMEKFLGSPDGILVATEMALQYLEKDVEHIIVASLDALLVLPDFRMNERVFHLLLTLRSRALKTFLVQTRGMEHTLFHHALTGHVSHFIREELAERKRFGYPPFTTLIKISRSGTPETIMKEMEQIKTLLASYAPVIYPASGAAIQGKAEMHALIKIPRGHWPDETLLRLLSALSPAFSINVDPESIL